MGKAVYKGKCYDKNGYAVHLFYEYRGHEYMITDERNGYSEPMWVKHRNEQDRIDRLIELEQMPRSEGSPAEEGFRLFWEYVEGGAE